MSAQPVLSVKNLRVEFPTRHGVLTAIDDIAEDPGPLFDTVTRHGGMVGAFLYRTPQLRPRLNALLEAARRGRNEATITPRIRTRSSSTSSGRREAGSLDAAMRNGCS